MSTTPTTTTSEPTGAPVVALGTPLVGGSHTRTHGHGTAGLEAVEAERAERLAAVREGRLGSVHSWELVTAVDGPGTRLTVFLSGCPLRCLYCHNPDTMEMRRGTDVSADEILAKVARYRGVFRATGGGLTISGGEPLMQPAFVRRLVRGAAAMGVPVAIDTSGFLGAHADDELLDDVDLVLLDVKSGLPDTYRRVTGRELQPTLDLGRRLGARGTRMWVRFVLVPGLTDDPENVAAVADHVVSFGPAVERVEVLPFHQMGRDKWDELGMRYELTDTEPPSPEATEAVREVFRARGLTTF
ncbi:pyruvate formate-lyase-activating protein [Cellulomonas shaoxiangyii]|uniref:Pyruvate formate-lyase-activating enzyme n=1 Tax=Cellulomonas shaoxiangyii TaxID=2566013 RepID=A0A4V1CMQ7_9CELL|nr:pyruvate formate-lyase-activating protein [Cellulomonas shaoxiangyii]QCB93785.1 pyruvate formate lyase-activating protein [Cellulomonas shaoxiangyii]TGY84928.1 pyruvate formate lyase-activating protein [Cellulomonas shaoxiangyii]